MCSQHDFDCLGKLKEFKCELLDPVTYHISVLFRFSSETDYFSNTELEVELKHNTDANEPERNVRTQIVYKQAKNDLSLFTILFDSSTNIHEAYNMVSKLYDIYSHALEAFFNQEESDDGNDED